MATAADMGTVAGMPTKVATPTEQIVEKIVACMNADGGFAWFEGMDSSPVITAVLLEGFAKLRDAGLSLDGLPSLDASVRFLDKCQFDTEFPSWRGGISHAQYMHVRSRYASVPFEPRPSGDGDGYRKRMSEFRKYARQYLAAPAKHRTDGSILDKARRLGTLVRLGDSPEGLSLAKSWGAGLPARPKLRRAMDEGMSSLLEYVVSHPDGGNYCPNAVMPWRGLLEGEAYAHSLICDLMADYAARGTSPGQLAEEARNTADGIRLWLMLQKETQGWDAVPAFVDAINSVMSGSDGLKSVSVMVAEATFRKSFHEIGASGNGMSVERHFYREVIRDLPAGDMDAADGTRVPTWEEIAPGGSRDVPAGDMNDADGTRVSTWEEIASGGSRDVSAGDMNAADGTRVLVWEEIAPGGTTLQIGEKIRVVYKIWNKENRSHVRLTAPHEASLTPLRQLSGPYGLAVRPMAADGPRSFVPRGYRDVRTDRSVFWFDTYPEASTTIEEDFFVTRAGVFTAPGVTIESVYAPHYRANSAPCPAIGSAYAPH